MATTPTDVRIGKVVEITGPVLVCQFANSTLPPINQALQIVSTGFDVPEPIDLIVEVQQHLGEGRVKCVAMQPTEGLVRGMQAIDTGEPHYRSGRPGHAGPGDERARPAGRQIGPHRLGHPLAHSPARAQP